MSPCRPDTAAGTAGRSHESLVRVGLIMQQVQQAGVMSHESVLA